MALSQEAVVKLAATLIADHNAEAQKNAHVGKVARYLKGEHDLPYMPRGAKAEFRHLAERSITNWLPLISDTFSKGLFVDGCRPTKSAENVKAWDYWQANGLDARQSIAHRGALEYGVAYALVLKGDPAPLIRPLSPKRAFAVYEDPDDEWPTYGLIRKGKAAVSGARIYEILDDEAVYTVTLAEAEDLPRFVGMAEHGLGVCPLVRFRDRLDGDAVGIIEPLIPIQDRINEAVFSLLIAIQYASFRQRWATGLAVPLDEETGEPVEPFESAVDRLWVSDSTESRFGDFAQTDTTGHLNSYNSAVKTLAAIAQTPPHVLLGDLVNLSADALAAAEAGTQRKVTEYETLFGESWEQVLRLAAVAAGDPGQVDDDAQVRWRDSEARSLASTVDALGKMAQMLMVPTEELWERIPGVTDIDVQRWKASASKVDGMAALAAALNNASRPNPTPETPETPPAPPEA